MERISEQERASLAEYIGKRKLVIDLLEGCLGYMDHNQGIRYHEKEIHRIVCPMQVNSGDIEYGEHNLWLIDDRLAYYDFWASDQGIQKFVKSAESKDRPDLIFFKGSHLLRRTGTAQPIVIVEFKRPGRTDYPADDDPFKRILGYIRKMRNRKVSDNNGRLITEIDGDTPFFCFLVCDITPAMEVLIQNYSINQALPGRRGYFGYISASRAYFEVLQYSEIVKDARLRHEAFFSELGIN